MNQPTWRGKAVGQGYGLVSVLVPTGKRFPAVVGGQKVWLPVRERRDSWSWVWDGEAWVRPSSPTLMRTASAEEVMKAKADIRRLGVRFR